MVDKATKGNQLTSPNPQQYGTSQIIRTHPPMSSLLGNSRRISKPGVVEERNGEKAKWNRQ